MSGADTEGDDLRLRVRRGGDVAEVLAALAADGGFAGEVARCEAWADAVLGPVLVNPHPERTPAWVTFEAARPKWKYPDRRWFAVRLRREVAAVRAGIDRGDALLAAMASLEVGKLLQEVNDRGDWGGAARLGAKVVRGGRDGGKARAGERAERDAQIRTAFGCLEPYHPLVGARYRKLAKDWGLSADRVKKIVLEA